MKYSDALISLKNHKSDRYALAGPNAFLKESFIKAAARVNPDMEIVQYDPSSQEQGLTALNADSFFTQPLIVLKEYDRILELSPYVNRFNGTVIMALSEGANLKSRGITEALSKTPVVECPKFKEYGVDYPTWIVSYITDIGYKVQQGAEDVVFSMIGPNQYVIANELEKLFVLKTDKMITTDDIKKYLSHTAVSTSYELFDHLLKGNTVKVLSIFESYARSQDNFIELTFFLGSFLEKMFKIALLSEKKADMKDIAEIVGVPFFVLKTKYASRINSLGKKFLATKIDSVCKLDVQLRLFKGNKRVLVENFFLNFSV